MNMPGSGQWYPFGETMRPEGAVIFAMVKDGGIASLGRCVWIDGASGVPGGWWSDDLLQYVEPTHWMPLPPLP